MMTKGEKQLLKLVNQPAIVDKHTIPISVKVYMTTVDGTVLDKTDPAIPSAMKEKYPYYMFGAFDYNGGYRIGNRVNPAIGCVYMATYTYGVNLPFLSFTGLNTIQNYLKPGDLVHIFADDKSAPNIFAFVVLSCSSAAYASILLNSETVQKDRRIGQIDLLGFNYSMLAPGGNSFIISRQLQEDFKYVFMDNIGMYQNDSVQPGTWKTPHVELDDIITVDLMFKLDQYFLFTSYIDYEIDSLQLNFNVNRQ